jgi:uncharacterized protein
MGGIRGLVAAISRRKGIDAAIILGRDGLLIEGSGANPEEMAARVSVLLRPADELGGTLAIGPMQSAVLEYEDGLVQVIALDDDLLLAVRIPPGADAGTLLADLRRHRTTMAASLSPS